MRDSIETRLERMSSDHSEVDLDIVSMIYTPNFYNSFKRYHQVAENSDARCSIKQMSFNDIRKFINMKYKSTPFRLSVMSFASRNLERCSYTEDELNDYHPILELEED